MDAPSRPVPVVAEAMVLAAGATRLSALHFVLACGAGNLVYALILAGNGAAFVPGALAGPGLVVPMLLEGIKITTSPDDFEPIQQLRLARFDGEKWQIFGDVISTE